MKFLNKKILIIFSAIVLVSFFGKIVLATPPLSFYEPGEELNPTCLPTDLNCDMRPPLTSLNIDDTVYGASWDTDTTHAPSKNALYDKIEGLVAGSHNPVTLGTANGLSLATQVLSLALASTSTTGALSDTDWDTFNNKLSTAVATSTYVPYTGATTNVDLGIHNLTVDTNSLFVDSVNHRVGIGTASPTVKLDVAGTLEIKNSTTAQTMNIYNTYTDGSTYERGSIGWSGNVFQISPQYSGGQTYRKMRLATPSATGYIDLSDNGGIDISWSTLSRARFLNNGIVLDGSVSIGGDTSPDGKLDIDYSGAVTAANYGLILSNLTTNTNTDGINKYGAYITSTGSWTGSTGTATNNYGLYVDTVSGADNNYGAYIAGNVGIGTTAPAELLSLGLAGTKKGVLSFAGNTSGKIIIQPADAAGTYTLTLPTAVAGAGQVLTDTAGDGVLSWSTPSSGITNSAGANVMTKSDGTNIVASSLNEATTGVFSTTAGTAALSFVSTAPTATTGASQVGKNLTLTASNAVASTDTNGAAVGGSVTITAGTAARRTSGDSDGGDIALIPGAGIGTNGYTGLVLFGSSGATSPVGMAYVSNSLGVFYSSGKPKTVIQAGNAPYGGGIVSSSAGLFAFSSTTDASLTPDLYLTRRAAANPAWGLASATPIAYTHTLAADSRAGTDTDIAGANATITPGIGTGTGGSGSLLFQVAPTALTGTSANTPQTVLTLANNATTLTTTTPTAQIASTAGNSVSITASPAVAGTGTAGAAAGGDVTITSGAAARLTSGNANGGNINLTPGTGIGTGYQGGIVLPLGVTNKPMLSFGGNRDGGFSGAWSGYGVAYSYSGNTSMIFGNGNGSTVKFPAGDSYTFHLGAGATLTSNDADTGLLIRPNGIGTIGWGRGAATPTPYTHRMAGNGSGTDIAGSNATITPGIGTGAGTAGNLYFATGDVTTTGSGLHAVTTKMTLLGNGNVGIGTTTPTSLFSVGSSSQFQVNSSGNIVSLNGVTTSFPASNASGVLTNNGSGTLTWAAGGGGITNSAGANVMTKSDGTNIVASSLNEASTGVFSTTAGTAALSFVSTAPTATTGASQVGKALTLTASPAVASTDTAGAAAGGDVTITAGDAARLTSGNAAGGNINLTTGTAIGTGYAGRLVITQGSYSQSIMLSNGGIYFGSSQGNHPPTGDSIGIGLNSMYGSVTGTKNIAIGTSSLRSVTSGAANTAIGFATGYANATYDDTNGLASASIVTGSNNTLFGSYTNTSLTSITNSTAIGYKSRISASNSVVLGNKEVTLLQLGSDSSDTQTARVIQAAGSRAGTDTDTAGSPLTISGGVGTGSAVSAPIYFATGDAGVSGTTAQTVTTKMTLTGAGSLGLGATVPLGKLYVYDTSNASTIIADGTTNPGFFLYTSGTRKASLSAITSADSFISGTVANDLAIRSDAGAKILFSTSATGVTNDLTLNGGKVGINTISPVSKLSVVGGDITVGSQSGAGPDSVPGALILSRYTTGSDWRASAIFNYYPSAYADEVLAFGVSSDTTPAAIGKIKMVIRADGKVGIGTVAPTQKLAVETIATGAQTLLTLNVPNTVGNNGALDFAVNNSGTIIPIAKMAAIYGASNDIGLAFSTFNTGGMGERLRIDKDGNVGIGTSAPTHKLDVNGSIRSTSYTTTTSGVGSELVYVPAESRGGVVAYDRANNLYKRLDLNDQITILGGATPGYVGIGIVAPVQLLHLASSSTSGTAMRFDNTDAGGHNYRLFSTGSANGVGAGTFSLYDETGASYRMVVDSTGKVGIGNTAPGTMLTVGTATTNTGNITVYGTGTTCTIGDGTGGTSCTSDIRLKDNIADLGSELNNIMALRPVTFNWKDKTKNQGTNTGLIAQEVQNIYPNAVRTIYDDYLGIDYTTLVVPAIKAIQELNLNLEGISGTITPLADSENETFVTAFFNNIKTTIGTWLADASNGIGNIFAGEVDTKSLCVSDDSGAKTCITKEQLDALLLNAGTTPAPENLTPSPSPSEELGEGGSGETGEEVVPSPVDPAPTEEEPVPTEEEPAPETTPTPSPEPAPEVTATP